MQLAFAMLARFADFARDGTLNMMGADFDHVEVPSFPCSVNVMLVVKLVPQDQIPSEPPKAGIFITDPSQNRVQIPLPEKLATVPPPTARRLPTAVSIFSIGLFLQQEGQYHLQFNVNGEDLVRLPLNVSLSNSTESAPPQAASP